MDPFITFIHIPKKKERELEPEPLYIELYPPMERIQKKEEKETDERGVIIIDL